MQLRSAIVSVTTFISIKLIRPSTGTRHKDSFNIISKRYNCFIKLPPLKIEKLACKDVVSKQ
jgi:hypothetical protein